MSTTPPQPATPPVPPPGPPPPSASSGCRSAAIIVGVVVACLVAVVLVIAGAAWWYLAQAEDIPVTAADRQAVLTAEHVAAHFDGFQVDESLSTYSKLRYPDDSWEVTCTYDDSFGEPPLFLSYALSVEQTVTDAENVHAGALFGAKIAWTGSDTELVDMPDLMSWGDESETYALVSDGEVTGYMFAGRKSERAVLFTISGVVFESSDDFHALLDPILANGEALTLQP